MSMSPYFKLLAAAALIAACGTAHASDAGARLVKAYPAFLTGVENGQLIWRDGTRMPLSDGIHIKTPEQLLEAPDLDDMFVMPYPVGKTTSPPTQDPGRVRYAPFFQRMYGDCTKDGSARDLVNVPWLQAFGGGTLRVTRVNGVDKKLAAAAADLGQLPPELIKRYLVPAAGAYNCRVIARTTRPSAHGFGIAIDIATRESDYWQWSKSGEHRNRIPYEIVEIFERHGFVWGGKWKAFDTMHFEYRPELLGQ
jgi:hypothetical protein